MKKRADGRYVETVTLNGKRRYFFAKTAREAREKAREYQKSVRTGISYALVADEWMDRTAPRLSPSTVRGYMAAFNRSKQFFRMPIEKIRAVDVSAFLDAMIRRHGLGLKAAANHLLVVRDVFSYGVNHGYVGMNPARDVSVPRGLHREKRPAADQSDIERMKQLPAGPHKTAAMLAFYAGLRRGEIIALRWRDVDLEAGTISVRRAVAYNGNEPILKEPKTAASLATVPILPALSDYLRKIPKKTGLVYPGKNGLFLNTEQQKQFDAWRKANGISFTLHQLRHSFATALWEADVPPDEAQILLRHASLRMTMDIYRDISASKTKTERIFERAKQLDF